MDKEEYLIVDRRNKTYAYFIDTEQQGNWIAFTDDAEPDRVAKANDIEIRESES